MKNWLPLEFASSLCTPLILMAHILYPSNFQKSERLPLKITQTIYHYFTEKPWLPMADIIVVGYGNGVQLFQRKAIIDLDCAKDQSVTALLSLHSQQFI